MLRYTFAPFALALTVFVTGATGCSGGGDEDAGDAGDDDDDDDDDHDRHDGGSDHEIDVYEAGMMKMGAEGTVHIMLMNANPAPPDKGNNTWTLRVMDMNENMLTGLNVRVEPWMPEHGHGTSPASYSATETDGSYEVGPFDLFMPGTWEITVHTEDDDDLHDHGLFVFDLEG